jgi:ppGpp synthetase/RelA/SpoT-type nucleotidyltranferase
LLQLSKNCTDGTTEVTLDEYEKTHFQLYEDFSQTVAGILKAAIEGTEIFLPPMITHRAKAVKSLRKKLVDRNTPLEADICAVVKDIAGCRAVFYTEFDASKISKSRLIYQTFDVAEDKEHYPPRGTRTVSDLYIGKHFWVRLSDDRIALPEYKRFAGLMCEIQIQTIFNHTWAAIEHDIIYKSLDILNFGGNELAAIGADLARIHTKYLKNAGYELDNVIYRYNRLVLGKALFDSNALDTIVAASDNNDRYDAIQSFREFVLRQYDDIPAVLVEIVQKLTNAARISKDVIPRPIVTDFGTIPPKTFADVLEVICNVLTEIRYQDIESRIIFEAILELHSLAETEPERAPVLKLAEAVSKYDLDVWKQIGPSVQAQLVEFIDQLPNEEAFKGFPIVVEILGNALSTEVEGRTWNSTSVSLRTGAVVASNSLRELRSKAIKTLVGLFEICSRAEERRTIVLKLFDAMRTPYRGVYSVELAQIVSIDSLAIINFFVQQATNLPFDERQSLEHKILWHYRNRTTAPGELADNKVLVEVRQRVAQAALLFRDTANSDDEFILYKILVGFESVFPEAWENRDFDYRAEEVYRNAQVEHLLEKLDDWTKNVWLERLNLFASTKSNDLGRVVN